MGKKNGNTMSKRRGQRQRVARPISSQPRSMHLKLKFATVQTLTEAAAGVGANYAYRLNSLYDPNATGVGAQPIGYDQWAALFDRSVVYQCKVKVEIANASASPIKVGVFPLAGATAVPGSGNSWFSQYGANYKLISSTGVNVYRFQRTYDIARLLGISRTKLLAEEDYSEATAGPAVAGNNQSLFYIAVAGIGAVAVGTVALEMEFTAKFFDPVAIALS